MAAGAIAVMRMQEREVVDDFRAVGATSPATARGFEEIGLFSENALARLRARAVIREAEPGRYYLDEEVWSAVRRQRQRMALVMLILVLAGVVLLSLRLVNQVNR